jgi:hypothetical protein
VSGNNDALTDLSIERDEEDDGMTHLGMNLAVGILIALAFGACERQGPPPKPIGSATNKHVEETPVPPSRRDADSMVEKMKTPMDDARQTEDVIKGAADRTRQQSDQANR